MKNAFNRLSAKLTELKAIRETYLENKNKKPKKVSGVKAPKSKKEVVQLEISTTTVIKVLLVFFLFMGLKNIIIEIQSVLIITGFCLFLAIGLSPILDKIESYHIPRPLAILILYAVFFGVLGLLFLKALPIIAEQLQDIAYDMRAFITEGHFAELPIIPQLFETANFDPQQIQSFMSENLSTVAGNLQSIAGSTFVILSGVFQGVFNFIFAAVLLFFMLMEREKIGQFSLLMFPGKSRAYIATKFTAVQTKMAQWFRGQFILMFCMGAFMYTGMKILEIFFGMKYAATIGLIAGVMEIFPYIGVFITGLLCVLIAINISWFLVIAVLAWMALAQFLEGNFLVPLVMEKVTGLSSVVVILAVSIGGILGASIGGVPMVILGMIFAVPFAASVAIFVEEYAHRED